MYRDRFGNVYHLTCLVLHGLQEQRFLRVFAAEERADDGQLKVVVDEPPSLLGGTLVPDYGRSVVHGGY